MAVDLAFAYRVESAQAVVSDHLAALRGDLQRRFGIGDEGLCVLVADHLDGLLADPAPAMAEIESPVRDR